MSLKLTDITQWNVGAVVLEQFKQADQNGLGPPNLHVGNGTIANHYDSDKACRKN